MSLKIVHLFFIISVIGLLLGCGGLSLRHYAATPEMRYLAWAGISFLLAGGFILYFFKVLRVLNRIKDNR